MLSILVVDDEYDTREGIKNNISWDELKISSVATAKNGLEALKSIQQHKPDIILTDIKMPKMDGITLATKVRELYPDIKIIFLTGYTEKEYLKAAISLQIASYVEKPVDLGELKSALLKAVLDLIPDLNKTRINEINNFIRTNLHNPELSLQTIADHVSLSKTYLCVMYKKETGITINEYINMQRIKKSKMLLKNHKYKLYEVAGKVGFVDANYFSTYFKKYVGVSPSEYRGIS